MLDFLQIKVYYSSGVIQELITWHKLYFDFTKKVHLAQKVFCHFCALPESQSNHSSHSDSGVDTGSSHGRSQSVVSSIFSEAWKRGTQIEENTKVWLSFKVGLYKISFFYIKSLYWGSQMKFRMFIILYNITKNPQFRKKSFIIRNLKMLPTGFLRHLRYERDDVWIGRQANAHT